MWSSIATPIANGVSATTKGVSAASQVIYDNTVKPLIEQGKEKHSGEKQNGTDEVETIPLNNEEKNLIKKDLQCVFSYYVERDNIGDTKNLEKFDSIRRIHKNNGQYSARPYANNDTVITKKFWTSIYGDICSTINSYYTKLKPCKTGITFKYYKKLSTVIGHWIEIYTVNKELDFNNEDGHLFQFIFMYYHGDKKLSDDSLITSDEWMGIFDRIESIKKTHTFEDFVSFFIGVVEGNYRNPPPPKSGGMKKRSRKSKRRNKKNGKTKKR